MLIRTTLACLFVAATLNTAQAQFMLPRPSPTTTNSQEFGVSKVELVYSRPSAKGRTMVGDHVPYDSLWRTGANGATKIRFNQPVQFGPTKVDTGWYAIYTQPGKANWTVILNKGFNNGGTQGYKKSDDVARFTVAATAVAAPVETFEMRFMNVKNESMDLELTWEKWAVRVPIKTDNAPILAATAATAEKGEKVPYQSLAGYYHEYTKNYPKALEMIDKAIAESEGKGSKPFWMYYTKAKILKDMGKKAEAKVAADKSTALAQEAKNADYVRMNKELAL